MIGPTILIKGDLTGEEDLLIDGRVEGKVELRKHNITVGKNGRVKADLYGKVITVEGEVHGNLYGDEQLVLRQSSTVRGNILAPRVVLEDGANFKGSIDMSPKDAAQREQPPSVPGPGVSGLRRHQVAFASSRIGSREEFSISQAATRANPGCLPFDPGPV